MTDLQDMNPRSWPGAPYPLGATFDGRGTNFALFSGAAESVDLCLLRHDGSEDRIAMTEVDSLVWHAYLPGVGPDQIYGYRLRGPWDPAAGQRFDATKLLLDPYAKAVAGEVHWDPSLYSGADGVTRHVADSRHHVPTAVVVDPSFDWRDDSPPNWAHHETIIYEAHVRGLTMRHPDVPPEKRGTFAGLAHPVVISYLLRLGVTAIELMPVHFSISEEALTRRGLVNYWGYNTLAFFAPHTAYAATKEAARVPAEFKEMVRALHANGLEVILDVVYNHTAEGDHTGPTLSLRGIDNEAYYRLDPMNPSRYIDYTGTGNSLNTRDPHTLQLIMDSLRYWVTEMHVDGFRFDLASVLAREMYDVDRLSGFFDIIQQDPILNRVKLIAEPWDLGPGGYQVGNFPPRWSEWNGRYRDTVRDFWRGAPATLGEFASRITGSSDLYRTSSGRGPAASVNYVTCHDGFTLADLVSYNRKHNDANGDENTDGTSDNRSWNCGAEGPTTDPAVCDLRSRQRRNLIATLMLSHGMPMILHGDEIGRTQSGNNNAYCHDSPLTWMDWVGADEEFLEFTRSLARLRAEHPTFHRRRFFSGRPAAGGEREVPDIAWFAADGRTMTLRDWEQASGQSLALYLSGRGIRCSDLTGSLMTDSDFILCFNASDECVDFVLPPEDYTLQWTVVVDTASHEPRRGEPLRPRSSVRAQPHSMLVLREPVEPIHAQDAASRSHLAHRPALAESRAQ